MIAADQAMRHVRGLTPEQLRALTQARLEGKDTVPVSSGYHGESTEDLVIGLLQSDDLPDTSRDAVLAGCKDTYGQILNQLAVIDDRLDLTALQEDMTRLCRVVDVTAPPNLASQARAVLTLVLETPRLPSSVRTAAVRAVLGYLQPGDEVYVPFWQKVLDHRDVAAYAFQALLIIDPHSPRIDVALRTLWRKQTAEQWPVDSAFLTRRAMRARDDERLPQQVLAHLRREPCWKNIANELRRRPWSEPWLAEIKKSTKTRLRQLGQPEGRGHRVG